MLYRDVLRYLGQPMPDLTGIFTTGAAQPFIQPQPDGLEQVQEQIDMLEKYPVVYQPYMGGGDGRDDENVIDTTNNAGIYSLSDLFSKIPTPFNLARTAIENIQNPYTNVFGNLNKETEEAIARDNLKNLSDITDLGSITGDARVAEDTQNIGRQDMIDTMDRISGVRTSDASEAEAIAAADRAAKSRASAIAQEAANREAARESAAAAAAAAAAQAAANRDAARGQTGGGGGGISNSQAEANRDAARGGQSGGGGGGGGKIVCTMMNESYGFGSFRNKIWLKHSKSLAPEYQKGYHKIFLPLVKYSKQKGLTNKIVKNILEHIAVHRTIDIRQESRGKTHLLGRIYRKILEPICYLVGKHG